MRLIHTADREGAECLSVHTAAGQLVLIVAVPVLEFGISIDSDIRANYTLLAELYKEQGNGLWGGVRQQE